MRIAPSSMGEVSRPSRFGRRGSVIRNAWGMLRDDHEARPIMSGRAFVVLGMLQSSHSVSHGVHCLRSGCTGCKKHC